MRKIKKYFKFPIKVGIPEGTKTPLTEIQYQDNLKRDQALKFQAFSLNRMQQRRYNKTKEDSLTEITAKADYEREILTTENYDNQSSN